MNPEQPIQTEQPIASSEPMVQQQPIAQPTFVPSQPQPVPQTPQMPYPQQATPQQPAHNPGHGLGLASLITSILGLGILGIILGIIGLKKSKQVGQSNTLSVIGIVWGSIATLAIVPIAIMAGLVSSNFQGAQGAARDTSNITRVNALHSKLEEYYNENNYYPSTIETSFFPGLDSMSLQSSDGKNITVVTGTLNSMALASVPNPSASNPYQYVPLGCTGTKCNGYELRVYIENPTAIHPNPYTKTGLQNP